MHSPYCTTHVRTHNSSAHFSPDDPLHVASLKLLDVLKAHPSAEKFRSYLMYVECDP